MRHWHRSKAKKGFQPAQRPDLNRYLALAWVAHCRREGAELEAQAVESCMQIGAWSTRKRCERDECPYCAWYADTLEAATGKRSSRECNAGRDFDFFMAALEEIHGQDVDWQMRKYHGDANRILHELNRLTTDHTIDEEYLRKVAANALRDEDGRAPEHLPELHTLPVKTLILIKNQVVEYVRGKLTVDQPF